MSDMYDDGLPDDPFGQVPDEIRAEADALMERWTEFADKCRTLGLYVQSDPQIVATPTPMGPKIGLAVQFDVGAVAFSARVQDASKDSVENMARAMDISLKDDMFLDERERIRKGLAEGKTMDEILLEGDDDDDGTE